MNAVAHGPPWRETLIFALIPLSLTACSAPGSICTDRDGDGYGEDCALGPDCNDEGAVIHPGAMEACDLVDSNCDGSLVDGFDNLDGDAWPDCVDDDELLTHFVTPFVLPDPLDADLLVARYRHLFVPSELCSALVPAVRAVETSTPTEIIAFNNPFFTAPAGSGHSESWCAANPGWCIIDDDPNTPQTYVYSASINARPRGLS